MKIALSLHGLFDSVQDLNSKGIDGYNHIKNNILNKGDVDVYIHSWEIDKQKEIEKLYNPKKSIFEPQIDFTNIVKERKLDKLPNTPRKPEVILSHLYSVTESIKLAYESKINYDLVIKARFDLGRINRSTSGPHNQTNPYPVQCINLQTNIEKNKLYMADWQYFKHGYDQEPIYHIEARFEPPNVTDSMWNEQSGNGFQNDEMFGMFMLNPCG